jgi:hypothetical protein
MISSSCQNLHFSMAFNFTHRYTQINPSCWMFSSPRWFLTKLLRNKITYRRCSTCSESPTRQHRKKNTYFFCQLAFLVFLLNLCNAETHTTHQTFIQRAVILSFKALACTSRGCAQHKTESQNLLNTKIRVSPHAIIFKA